MSKEFRSFICDSFWPMVLAQTGVFGLVLYALAVCILFVRITDLRRLNKYYYSSALGAFFYLLVDSTAATAFVHPLSMPIAIWAGVLISSVYQKNAESLMDNQVYFQS